MLDVLFEEISFFFYCSFFLARTCVLAHNSIHFMYVTRNKPYIKKKTGNISPTQSASMDVVFLASVTTGRFSFSN